MPITIKGIRIEDVSIGRDEEKGGDTLKSATYSLISSADKVLAKQSIGGYGNMTIEPSPATKKALAAFMDSYKADVATTLGLEI